MWTLPNILTLARAVAGLPVAVLALMDWWWAAFALFGAAAATDWLDGRIARARGQISEFGRFLDPIADKLMVAAALVVLVAQGIIAGWGVLAAILILVRELLVAGLREHLAPRGVVVHVSALAKWKTAAQLAACALLLLAVALPSPAGLPLGAIGAGALWVAAALTVWTGVEYLHGGLQNLES